MYIDWKKRKQFFKPSAGIEPHIFGLLVRRVNHLIYFLINNYFLRLSKVIVIHHLWADENYLLLPKVEAKKCSSRHWPNHNICESRGYYSITKLFFKIFLLFCYQCDHSAKCSGFKLALLARFCYLYYNSHKVLLQAIS